MRICVHSELFCDFYDGIFYKCLPMIVNFFQEIRSGISGIEKKIQQKAINDSKDISKAFQDLDRYLLFSYLLFI